MANNDLRLRFVHSKQRWRFTGRDAKGTIKAWLLAGWERILA